HHYKGFLEEKIVMTQDEQKEAIDQIRANVSQMLDGLDPQAPIGATVVFKVDKTKEETFVRNAGALEKATKKLLGCILFVYQKHQPYRGEPWETTAVEYLIYEDWESVELFRTQWNSKHLKDFQYTVLNLFVEPPDLTFYRGWQRAGTSSRLPRT